MISKFKKSFPLVCRACQDESIDIQHQRFRIKTDASYSFEDRAKDRLTESISECTLKYPFISFNDLHEEFNNS